MFNTWKQNNDSYVVLPNGPPFERPQNGKPRRSACNPCRARKIRCTSEPNGCRNCRTRSLQCEYGSESDTDPNFGAIKGRRQMKQKERSASGSEAPMTPFTDGDTTREHLGRLQGSNMSEAVAEGSQDMHTEIHQLESDWSEFMFGSPQDPLAEPTNSNSHSHDTAFDATTGISEIFNSPATFLTSPPLESILNDDLYQHGSFPFSQSAPELNKAVATEADSVRGDRVLLCQCSATPLETWEALTINISYKDSTSERSIQSQKAAISSTEDILDCDECSSKSQNIILLIDICAKLLESLKAQDKEFQKQHQHKEHRPAVYEMTDNGGEDEGTHVRRNLWMSRMRRLGRLIAKVGELLDGDQWSAQRRLLQDVQLRFTGVMFGWQH